MDPFPLTGTIVVILSNRNSIVHIHVNATEVVHVHVHVHVNVNVNVNVNALKLQRKLGTAVVVQETTKLPYVYTIVLQLVNNNIMEHPSRYNVKHARRNELGTDETTRGCELLPLRRARDQVP